MKWQTIQESISYLDRVQSGIEGNTIVIKRIVKNKKIKENTKQDLSIVQIVYNEDMLATLPWSWSLQNDKQYKIQSVA